MLFLQREKSDHVIPDRIRDAVAAWVAERLAGKLDAPDPLTEEEREQLCAYEYALGPAVIEDGDIVVPAGWGPRSALTVDAAHETEESAAVVARLLGCSVAIIAPPADPPEARREPSPEEQAAAKLAAEAEATTARRARVAAYLAEQQAKAEEAARIDAARAQQAMVDAAARAEAEEQERMRAELAAASVEGER